MNNEYEIILAARGVSRGNIMFRTKFAWNSPITLIFVATEILSFIKMNYGWRFNCIWFLNFMINFILINKFMIFISIQIGILIHYVLVNHMKIQ